MNLRQAVARGVLAAAVVLCSTSDASAAAVASDEPPELTTALAVVAAGGGPDAFKTTTLLGVLAGASANAEVAKLVKLYGAADIKQFMVVSDFVVADGLRAGRAHGFALPTPSNESIDGHAIVTQLHAAGIAAPGKPFAAEHMLDALVSPPLRMHVMRDVIAMYGRAAAQRYLEIVVIVIDDFDVASARSVRAIARTSEQCIRDFDRTSHVE